MKDTKISRTNDYTELDEDITLTNLVTGLYSNYAHARVSNGKLNIVLGFYTNANVVFNKTGGVLAQFEVPADIYSKLYAAVDDKLSILDVPLSDINGNTSIKLFVTVGKAGNNKLYIYYSLDAGTTSDNCLSRFEFNFLLS